MKKMKKKLKIRKNRLRKEPSSEAKEPQGKAPQWHKHLIRNRWLFLFILYFVSKVVQQTL
ncbi:MAG: hypothetical protein LBQ76_05270 [Candidatus Fibromonas sp.]|nr:hypothetical protein [Candidatus Fibromonas sp.]